MTTPRKTVPVALARESKTDTATGLPLLRTWPVLYTLILSAFVLYVLLLTLLTKAFNK
jgi:hypothetical protein